jgi:hypothetical protein
MKNNRDNQEKVALECFRIVNGPGDSGCEHEFNCLNGAAKEGWMKLAAKIITEQLAK